MNQSPRVVEIDSFEVDRILRSFGDIVLVGRNGENPVWVVVNNSMDFSLLQEGDVVVFSNENNEFVIHELLSLNKDKWNSSGSYHKYYDTGIVTRSNLRGVVTLIYKLKQ